MSTSLPLFPRHPEDGFEMADPYPMSARAQRALLGQVRVICPSDSVAGDHAEAIALHVRRVLRYMHPLTALGFVVTVHLLAWSPLWRFAGLTTLHRLPRERASAILDGMAHSRVAGIRMLVVALRGVVLSTYFDQARVHEALGYEPVPFLAERVALRGRILAGEEPTASDAIVVSPGPPGPPAVAVRAPSPPRPPHAAPRGPSDLEAGMAMTKGATS